MRAFVVTNEHNYEGERVVGVFDTLEAAKAGVSNNFVNFDRQHIREFEGTTEFSHISRKVKYVRVDRQATGCFTSVKDGIEDWS